MRVVSEASNSGRVGVEQRNFEKRIPILVRSRSLGLGPAQIDDIGMGMAAAHAQGQLFAEEPGHLDVFKGGWVGGGKNWQHFEILMSG